MTYCLSLLCHEGLIFLSDSRTSAGMDNIRIHQKMHVFTRENDRMISLMCSGSLSLSQSVLALIREDLRSGDTHETLPTLLNQATLYETARYVGGKIREVGELDRAALENDRYKFDVNFIMGGQLKGQEHQIYLIYPQGNMIHASLDYPYLQIGDSKYGKPILDRGFRYDTTLQEGVKFGLLSMDATMKSNVGVGPPVDIFVYERDSLRADKRVRLEQDDPYLATIARQWQEGIAGLVRDLPTYDFSQRLDREIDPLMSA